MPVERFICDWEGGEAVPHDETDLGAWPPCPPCGLGIETIRYHAAGDESAHDAARRAAHGYFKTRSAKTQVVVEIQRG